MKNLYGFEIDETKEFPRLLETFDEGAEATSETMYVAKDTVEVETKRGKNSGAGARQRKQEQRNAERLAALKLLQELKISVQPDGTFTPNGRNYYKVGNATFLTFKNLYKKEIEEALKTGKPFKAKI